MIRVTVWYEYVQEAGEFNEEFLPKDMSVEEKARLKKRVADVARALNIPCEAELGKDKRSLSKRCHGNCGRAFGIV